MSTSSDNSNAFGWTPPIPGKRNIQGEILDTLIAIQVELQNMSILLLQIRDK